MPDFFPPLTWLTEFPYFPVSEFEVFPRMKKFRNCGSWEHLMCSYEKIWPQGEIYPPCRLATFSRLYIHINNLCSCSRYQNQCWLCSAMIPDLPEMIYCMKNVQMPPPPGNLPQSHSWLAGTNLSIFCPSITLLLYFSASDLTGCLVPWRLQGDKLHG